MSYTNIEKQRACQRRFMQSRKEWIATFKDKPCADCGKRYPHYVMDFDHTGDKNFTISKNWNRRKEIIKAEIEKCAVVCANCHRERTQQRHL